MLVNLKCTRCISVTALNQLDICSLMNNSEHNGLWHTPVQSATKSSPLLSHCQFPVMYNMVGVAVSMAIPTMQEKSCIDLHNAR